MKRGPRSKRIGLQDQATLRARRVERAAQYAAQLVGEGWAQHDADNRARAAYYLADEPAAVRAPPLSAACRAALLDEAASAYRREMAPPPDAGPTNHAVCVRSRSRRPDVSNHAPGG